MGDSRFFIIFDQAFYELRHLRARDTVRRLAGILMQFGIQAIKIVALKTTLEDEMLKPEMFATLVVYGLLNQAQPK